MAWLGKVSLGNFSSDIAGAVNKLSESVKSIERNFDNALGFEAVPTPIPNSEDLILPKATDRHAEEPNGVETTTAEEPTEDKVHFPETIDSEERQVFVNVEPIQVSSQTDEAPVLVVLPTAVEVLEEEDDADEEEEDEEEDQGKEEEGRKEDQGKEEEGRKEDKRKEEEEEEEEEEERGCHAKLKSEMEMMENALQGAAKQAQMKADEISRLLQENEHLKCALDEAKKKISEVEVDALREEYQHRLGAAERKVYALTKERDMLRRELNRKSDSSTLLKEKDEIIKQVMAEGEELSKKQATQEAQIKKLRAQVRELEEEKQRLSSKLQIEEAKVESIKKDKAATESLLQETVEKGHADLAAQREFYTKIVNEARESEARAEARASSQAKADLDQRLHDAAERESALVQTIEELRQGLTRTEQQASYREDVLRKDIENLERRCQDSESRYDDLVARVPESTRPLLRQIEAMQEASAMRAEAWSGVERALNSRLQEAEAKAAAAQERERATNERLSQTLSRLAIMETQILCVKSELSQVTRSLEKERVKAAETRHEYLAALETAATHEGRSKQLEEELNDQKAKQMQLALEERSRRLALEEELEKEQSMRCEAEKRMQAAEGRDTSSFQSNAENSSSRNSRRLRSLSSVEEGQLLQASLDSSSPSPVTQEKYNKYLEVEQLEAVVRQKEGELASYAARLVEMETTRDRLAEELVKSTSLCEKLRSESSALRGLRVELEALRARHASALELMGERDEQVDELRADLADVKQMYREQIDMLVSQIVERRVTEY